VSAAETIFASRRISSPFNPCGYPDPSSRSWCWWTISAILRGKSTFLRMLYPSSACALTRENSMSSSLPGLLSISDGTLIFPTSWIAAAAFPDRDNKRSRCSVYRRPTRNQVQPSCFAYGPSKKELRERAIHGFC